VRLGTPAATTRGMREPEMRQLGSLIMKAVINHEEQYSLEQIRQEVEQMCRRYPVPGID